jgi:flagellar motor protein MotB
MMLSISRMTLCAAVVTTFSIPAVAQDRANGAAPIFQVTVVERTVKAINYQYRSGPTLIDFRGTVLMPKAHGVATVSSKQGRTEIDVGFDHLTVPSQFGAEYLTYVLWALTPDGRPHNIGEIIPNSIDRSHLRVTTDLQAFAMIVTAEPYAAVRQPGDVVVMENQVRPETTGVIEQVNARYELMPRGHYSWNVPAQIATAENGPRVSTREYEELIELYQAQNAIGVARNAGAAKYAPDILAKADNLLSQAQQLHARKKDRNMAIQDAREAAQTAEDARLIAEQRTQQAKVEQAKAEAAAAHQGKIEAEQASATALAAANQAREESAAAEARLAAEREARLKAERQAAAAQTQIAAAQAVLETERAKLAVERNRTSVTQEQIDKESKQRENRRALLGQLNAIIPTRDASYGLVVTVPDAAFQGSALMGSYSAQVLRISRLLAAHPMLAIEVQGHSDMATDSEQALRRAHVVSDVITSQNVPNVVSTRGYGDTRLLGPNNTPQGREQNRRIDIVISGDEIGSMALWDHPYTIGALR